jgi:YegS/Rv2252/BmrU family lipid kinase
VTRLRQGYGGQGPGQGGGGHPGQGSVTIIINPISGTGGRPGAGARRAALAAAALRARQIDGQVLVTERGRHACELARAALANGASLVIAWGGDGTVNEVASELAFGPAALGIVPSGSGNGLARELRLPLDPASALTVALEGREIVIDAGELDGRLFFNIAGVGLDARVAHEFASNGLVKRGFVRYLTIAARELFTFTPDEHTIVVDGGAVTRTRALLVAIANGTQYGNRARIAPFARVDDGRLDVVIVADRSPVETLLQAPMLFAGQVARVRGVTMQSATDVEITSARPVMYHVDGEPFVGGASLKGRVRPKALRVRVAR